MNCADCRKSRTDLRYDEAFTLDRTGMLICPGCIGNRVALYPELVAALYKFLSLHYESNGQDDGNGNWITSPCQCDECRFANDLLNKTKKVTT